LGCENEFLGLGVALVKPFVFGGAAPNGFEKDGFDDAPKVVGVLLNAFVDDSPALGPAGAPNTLVEGWFVAESPDCIPKTLEVEVLGCEGAPNGFREPVPAWVPEGIPKMLVEDEFGCEGAPKGLLVELVVENGFEFVEASCFGAKGLNVPLAGEENEEEFEFALFPNGFEGAGEAALLKGSTFCSAGGSVNRTCLLL
jgi:hypothetical protein